MRRSTRPSLAVATAVASSGAGVSLGTASGHGGAAGAGAAEARAAAEPDGGVPLSVADVEGLRETVDAAGAQLARNAAAVRAAVVSTREHRVVVMGAKTRSTVRWSNFQTDTLTLDSPQDVNGTSAHFLGPPRALPAKPAR
jgi:hypothetical protein